MSLTKSLLNTCSYNYVELVPDKAFKITPRSIMYKMDIVVIVEDEQAQDYIMMLWIDDDLKKEVKVKFRANINSTYSSLFLLGTKLIDNSSKTRKNESNQNTTGIS